MTKQLDAVTAGALDLRGIRHGFFTRTGGVSTGLYATLNAGQGSADDREAVGKNRRRVAEHIGVTPDRLVTMHQIHSADAVVIEGPGDRPRCDGMATNVPGLALAVLTADCAPLLFADPVARVVAVAHSGWRGAVGGIVDQTLVKMEALGARRENIRLAIGPTIAQASYEVGPGFVADVLVATPCAADLFTSTAAGKTHFDLPGYVATRARHSGVGTVEDLKLDTYADEARFFSYRRATHRGEPDYGRMISAIVLEA